MKADALDIVALPAGVFVFAPEDPWPGQTGVVVAYAIRHHGGVFLFDTGFGLDNAELNAYYTVTGRPMDQLLRDAGIEPSEVTSVANCHLHADHSGQNSLFPDVPIYVQPAEWRTAHETADYTILDWIDFDGADYRQVAGDHEVAPGIRIYATPGHSPGHQSLVVDTPDGPILLAGQAVYSHGEWTGVAGAREGATRAPDEPAYARSVTKLRDLRPKEVLFGHDRRGWP